MVSEYVVLVLMRVLLPTGLLLSIALRPFGLSIIYLLLFLLAPLSQVPNSRYSFKGIRGKFLLLVLLVSILLILVHVAWHSVLAAFVPYGSMLEDNPLIEKIGLNLGLVSYSEIDPMMAVHYMAPELVMTATSLVVYFGTKRLVSARTAEQIRKDSKHQRYPLLTNTGKYICVLLMMLSGIMRPSVTSGIYFLVFIGCATAWALGRPLERGFAVIGRCLMAIMAVHVMVLIAYQSSWTINFYPPEKDFARYFGLTKLVIINETDPNEFIYEDTDDQAWATMASPLIILFTYFVLAIETRELFKPKAKRKSALTGLEAGKQNGSLLRGLSLSRASRRAVRDKWMSATKKARVAYPYKSSKVLRGNTSETTPLIQNLSVTTTKRSQFTRSQTNTRQLHQDSIGSVIFGDDDSVLDANEPTLKDDIIAAIIDFFQVLVRSSYIATTITMMAWSILFHSWLTFVFLMWANVVWLCQNQRSFMLKTSPILVFYAIMLLITQYVYGMDLTESELPSNITEVNLRQFGLKRPDGEACVPLLVKSMFTLVFWLTLRQRVQESQQRKQSAVITDMAAPLQLTISAAASVIETQHEEEGRSRLLRVLGDWLRSVCARYWIYVVVIMLFVIGIGIGGERMTIFRIIYMFLFLVFILMFQISWYWWRRLMYVFWITVIIYAMINLILIYVYQFDGCAKIIEHYLFINEKLQHDLGLEPYHPADLFVKLLTPTAFLIITIMQVHYFHKDFMAMSEPKTRTNTIYKEPSSSRPSNAGASTMKDDLPPLPLEEEGQTSYDAENSAMTEHERRSINMSSAHTAAKRSFARQSRSRSYAPSVAEKSSAEFVQVLVGALRSARDLVLQWRDKMFMYLDIHLFKVIMVALMLLCVFNVCAMNAPIMILISPALLMRPRQQRFCVLIISTLISIYFMAQMVYQIDYINHSHYDVNCSSEYSTTLLNNAQWVGFMKSSADRPLVTILKGHIALIVIFTLYSLVTYRQQTLRQLKVYPEYKSSDKMIFPNITRKEADIDLVHCIKYLINYGFYKFGVEITLICLMGVIGSRMDIYAVIYALWLLVLVSFQRTQQARIWNVFTVFITFIVPLQYMIAVGFIPMLCISYPWSGDAEQMKHVRNWLFLPYTAEPPNAIKLIFDYFLLLFASRQRRIFMIEKEKGDNYPGGSNSEARDMDWETSEFVNPVPDFLGFVGTWLDVLKRMIFLGMLWVTLAIMFMTGTNRVNLFSMGYLMGSFIFLWQGTDFYLLPKEAILKWWSWLLLYNVAVVVTKTLLQIPGCIFSATIQEHACWLVQLLGIGCVDKFAGGNIANFIKMSYAKNATCTVPQEDIGLAWDGVCFAFLILQRRLFHSYYFYRVIDESKATTVLASRGAELIEHLRLKQMRIQEDREVRILEKIKVKMEKIKANQKKIQGVITKESRHHDAGSEAGPSVRRAYTKRHEVRDYPVYRTPTSHKRALHSGDYYMFDEFDDTDDHIKDEEDEELDIDAPKEMGIGKLVSTVIKTDLKHAVLLRRASAPNIRASLHPSPGSYPHSYPHESHPPTPQPSTAHERDIHLTERVADDRDSTMDDYAPVPETWLNKLKRYIETAWAFISSFLVSITCHVMKFSRDYRYVSRMLTLEKKILKENKSFGIGIREGSQLRWEPLPENIVQNRKLSDISVPEIRILAPSMERGLDASPASSRASRPPSPSEDDTSEHESAFSLQSSESQNVTALEDQDDSMFQQDRNAILHLTYAIWYAVLAHTDIVCYIMVFINQIQSATILSIPLPLMVFLWGTLTIPRPTKSFWVTLIAYTEVIVLIKSMFQFEILPWNQKAIPDNMPFTAPRIIGIERKFNYALYDLLLLLIMFLHRFMLKSLGLWKETTPEVELRDDTEYEVKPDDTQMLVEGQGAKVGRNYIDLHDRTGPCHPLVDRLYHVHKKIIAAMNELEANRSDPRVAKLVSERLHFERRGQHTLRRPRAFRVPRSFHEAMSYVTPRPSEIEPESGVETERRKKALRASGGDEAGPSKRNESLDHYEVTDDKEPIIAVMTILEEPYNHYPKVMWLSLKRYLRPTQQFFKCMLAPGARVTADIYAYMFLCDFFNFHVVIFGFAAFGTHQGDGGVQAYLEENKVPIPFLVMLILQFVLIIIDRALYLRKFMLGKILFQYALIIGVHVWMFFVLPFITERTFNSLMPPKMWYLVKCIYLLLSAYQIRCGYPRRIIGNFLCKSYHFFNMVFYRCFMAVPFVFELRTLMDWIWTDTSMTLMDWLKMEDIFASVFLLKCSRYIEDEYPQPRGSKKSTVSKYLLGGGVLVFIIAIIWFPLVFFAFGNTVGEPNPPTDVTVKIRIGPFLPVYQMSAQSHNIDVYTEQDYAQLSNLYARDRSVQTFLSNYMFNDLAVITINPNSTMSWDISPPELARLEREVESNSSLQVKFTFVITHPSNNVQNPPTIEDSREVTLPAFIDDKRNPERETLYNMLTNKADPTTWLNVEELFPKFLKVFNKGTAKPASQLIPGSTEMAPRFYRDVQLRLEREGHTMYWRVREACSPRDTMAAIPMNNCDMLVLYTFNDKLFPETLNFISGSGIIGLYTTFVFLASRVIRGFFSGIYTKIMFDDLPNVDRVLQLCLDIYLVREALEMSLEEDLFAKLVFLYRSPETMIKWSRPREEETTEEQRALPPPPP